MTVNPTKADRYQLRDEDVADPVRLRSVLNECLLDLSKRVEALEAVKGIVTLPEVAFDTGASLLPTAFPFSLASGGVKVSCPFTPSGVVLLRLQNLTSSAVSSSPSDVKWRYGAGPNAGDGVLHIDFVTGLAANSSYRMLLGVTRG